MMMEFTKSLIKIKQIGIVVKTLFRSAARKTNELIDTERKRLFTQYCLRW